MNGFLHPMQHLGSGVDPSSLTFLRSFLIDNNSLAGLKMHVIQICALKKPWTFEPKRPLGTHLNHLQSRLRRLWLHLDLPLLINPLHLTCRQGKHTALTNKTKEIHHIPSNGIHALLERLLQEDQHFSHLWITFPFSLQSFPINRNFVNLPF